MKLFVSDAEEGTKVTSEEEEEVILKLSQVVSQEERLVLSFRQ
jgi:hypothetical protein